MQYLKDTDLVDHVRQNVIVVVTKSLTFWTDYEDFSSDAEKNAQWQLDAEEKKKIIDGLRIKVFPSSPPGSDVSPSSISWPVIFVENGGAVSAMPKRLPNNELSHQNLFEAILNLVAAENRSGEQDLVGLQALRFVTGVDSARPSKLPYSEENLTCSGRATAVVGTISIIVLHDSTNGYVDRCTNS
jgi:hypothetical protein